MAISDGQRVNAQVTNDAFVSRTVDSDTVGVVGLNHASSGGLIPNAQQQINDNDAAIIVNAADIASNDVDIATLFTTKQDLSEKDVANGYAGLDGSGKISQSALPLDVMQFKGVWNATTNTPTLIDGTGDDGDVYRVSVAGSQDLGSGSQTFNIGDWVTYNGTIWERSDFGGGVGVIDDLTDVDTTTVAPTDTQVLTWVNANSMWEPKDAPAADVSLNVVTKAASGAVLTTENMVLADASGGSITLDLPTAVGNSGLELRFKRTDSSLSNTLTIEPDGVETVDGSTNTNLSTLGEVLHLVSDGTEWIVIERKNPSIWVAYTPTGSWTSNVTYTGFWKRNGDSLSLDLKVEATGAPNAAALTIDLPTGLVINTTRLTHSNNFKIFGMGTLNDADAMDNLVSSSYNTTTSLAVMNYDDGAGAIDIGNVTQINPKTIANGDFITVRAIDIPITGWNA